MKLLSGSRGFFSYLIFVLLMSDQAAAFVSTALPVTEGHWLFDLKYTREAGKIEPNENELSFQSADIQIATFGFSRGTGDQLGLKDTFFRFEANTFSSKREEKDGQLFYDADNGQYFSAYLGGNFIHIPSHSFGFFMQTTFLNDVEKEKFSNPAIHEFSAGLNAGVEFTPSFGLEIATIVGSGIRNEQNSSVSISQLFVFKNAIATGLILKAGPYFETDLTDRRDERYDAVYSPPGRSDRIRAAKIGTTITADINLSEDLALGFVYVQKLGGYDARATQLYSTKLSLLF